MRIVNSNVVMESKRSYAQSGIRGAGTPSGIKTFQNITNQVYEKNNRMDAEISEGSLNYGKDGMLVNEKTEKRTTEAALQPSQYQIDIRNKLLRRMAGQGMFGSRSTSGIYGSSTWAVPFSTAMISRQEVSYEESENTEFYGYGKAETEDGREINFGISVKMSRSYMEYTNVKTSVLEHMMMDPLVINVSSEVADISDQVFLFDLDADGVEDQVSALGKSSGFLALDKNGDGIINDGSELFGTVSGDGFADLREYDSDGNGWIDENDAIFARLKVWCKGEHGEDILMDLTQADIGAIFLGEQDTEFSMTGKDGSLNAQIRSTGMFLKESGGTGTIQHVDLAVKQGGEAPVEQLLERIGRKQANPAAGQQATAESRNAAYQSRPVQTGGGTRQNSRTEQKNRETEHRRANEEQKARRHQLQEQQVQKIIKRRTQTKKLAEKAEQKRQEFQAEQFGQKELEQRLDRRERYEWTRFLTAYNVL